VNGPRGFAVLWTILSIAASLSLGALCAMTTAGAATAAPVPMPTPTPTPTPRPDVRIRVVFFPATVIPPQPDANGVVASLPYTVQDVNAAIMPSLVQSVQQRQLYDACLFDGSAACNPGSANIIITTTFKTDSVGSTAKSPTFDVTLNAIDMINRRALNSLSQAAVALSKDDVLGSSGVRKTALQLLNVTPDRLTPLLGAPTILDGKLALVPGYQPYIQLVPTLANANDPTYFSVFQNLLARRGLPAEPSQFNAGAVTSASTPLDAICGLGQRYLVYSLNIDQIPMTQNFSTRLEAHANGRLYDCNDFTVTPVGIDKNTHVITSKGSLASIAAILATVFTKSPGFAKSITVATLASDFIDTKPDSQTVRDQLSESALRMLVDRLCFTLDQHAAEATPEPILPALALAAVPSPGPSAVAAQTQETKKTNDVAFAAKKTTEAAVKAAGPATFGTVEQSVSRHAVTKQQLTTLENAAKTVQKLATDTANRAAGTATAAQAATAKTFADEMRNTATILAATPPRSIKPNDIKLLKMEFNASSAAAKSVAASAATAHKAAVARNVSTAGAAGAAPTTSGAGTPATATGAAPSAGAGGLASLDVGSFVAPKPVPLKCRAHVLDNASPTEPPRWHQSRWSSASPAPTPSTTP
jgi:hypothetical protein